MIAANRRHKEVALILSQKGANLNLVNAVSPYLYNNFHMTNSIKLKIKCSLLLLNSIV